MRRRRLLVAGTLTVLLLAPIGWLWWTSLLPGAYSVMEMGYADYGGGPGAPAGTTGHTAHAASTAPGDATAAGNAEPVSVATLTGPAEGIPDVSVTLVARAEKVRLEGAGAVPGYTLNGTSPGPTISAKVGDLVQVRLVNESVPEAVTLHWHGYDVPNAEDGVAGVTQDAVPVGAEHVYRFVATDAGSYWYHSHQVSHRLVKQGLFGALVVRPAEGGSTPGLDLVAQVHTYGGSRTINARVGESRATAPPGAAVRVRVINTNDGALRAWVSGASYQVVAVDGRDLLGPTPVTDRAVTVAAGGRVDLAFDVPPDGSAVRVGTGGRTTSLVVGPDGAPAPRPAEPKAELDLLGYGWGSPAPFDPWSADRVFDYDIGRRPWFLDGRPGLWWTVNGHLFPDVPMYVVSEGDVVRMRIANHSGQVHPMHLHGHHVLVLNRDGEDSTGSPLWLDSLNVADGQTYEVAFVADNPGVWMDHCHNLPHAAEGLVAHVAYTGVTTPYLIGGAEQNAPE